jgi:hypothetical protein
MKRRKNTTPTVSYTNTAKINESLTTFTRGASTPQLSAIKNSRIFKRNSNNHKDRKEDYTITQLENILLQQFYLYNDVPMKLFPSH